MLVSSFGLFRHTEHGGKFNKCLSNFNGEPLDFALALAYWIHPHASYKPGANPPMMDVESSGMLHCCLSNLKRFVGFVEFVREVSTKYEVNSLITISAFTGY